MTLIHLSPVGRADQRVHRRDEGERNVRQLRVVFVAERVVEPPVELLAEGQQQLAQTLIFRNDKQRDTQRSPFYGPLRRSRFQTK